MQTDFKALVIHKRRPRSFTFQVEKIPFELLPEENIVVRVKFSSVNYKDLMSCQGNPAITRHFPHIPGLDAAGVVVKSHSDQFQVGDKVVAVSSPMGMNHFGGFSEYISVPSNWLISLPEFLTQQEAMAYGTAGYTAALAVEAIQKHTAVSGEKKVLVTGANGGVGVISIGILKKLGFFVTAVTRHPESTSELVAAGADQVISIEELLSERDQNMLRAEWNAAIDVVGGDILSRVLKKIHDNGIVISVGLASGTHFQANVLPFILRGISLVGINAENVTGEHKEAIWNKMATSWKPNNFNYLYRVISLETLPEELDQTQTKSRVGRTVISMVTECDPRP